MPDTHYQVPKKLVITLIIALVGVIVSLLVHREKKQDEGIAVNSKSVQTTMKQMMKQDKAVGIIAKDIENHKDNNSAHVK